MTTLHWILLALGALLIAGVLVYNNLQERRMLLRVRKGFEGDRRNPRDDVLEAVSEVSPRADDWPEDALGLDLDAEPESGLAIAPEPEEAPEPSPPASAADELPPASAETCALDGNIECVVRLRLPKTPVGDFQDLLKLLRGMGRSFRILGQREDGVWEPVGKSAHVRYGLVDAGLQLANRSGPVTSEQVETWCRHLRQFAALHGGNIECQPVSKTLERAADLDRFCISVDVLIGLNVVAPVGYPFRGEAVHRLLTDAGMSFDPAGIYQMRDRQGTVLFSLSNQESSPFVDGGKGITTHGLVLLLDVPRVKDGVGVFDAMTALGQRIASELSGMVVDDRGRPVSPYSLQNDRRQLADYYRRMRAHNIEPGGDRALRLFS